MNLIVLYYLRALITYVSQPKSTQLVWHGFFISISIFIVGCIQSLMLNLHYQRMMVIGMRIRTALTSAIYKKSLVLSNSAKKESTTGEIVNLMSGKHLSIKYFLKFFIFS